MILKRGVKIQLIAFALITVIGVTVVSVNYIGFGRKTFGRQYTAFVDLTDSGGVFTNAEVTYRGVPVGRVGPIRLTESGIKVELTLDRGQRIPRAGTKAVVANRSAVGEQYIDLQPARRTGPYLDQGAAYTIPRELTTLPVSTAELLRNVDRLVSSVDPKNLGTIVDELDKAFSGSAADLQSILDDTDRLLKTADQAYPDTKKLLDNSVTVLDTQRAQGANILGFSRNLNELTTQLRKDDPALRRTIEATPGAVVQADKTIEDLAPTLPVLLANMTTTGQIIASHKAGLRSLLIMYPMTVAGAFTVTPGDGTQHLGLALNFDSPPPCTKGYEKVKHRWPQDTGRKAPRLDVGCTDSPGSPSAVRGARNFPKQDLSPVPKVPAGATDGAGFPAGGASGNAAGAPKAESGKGGKPAAKGAGEGSGSGDAALAANNSLYVPFSSESVEIAGYDPSTGTVYGPDGKRYGMGANGGQQRILGESSWKMLLLGPLSQ
ncbi:MCE family protein [Actinomadura xylanilytica]|uniref:MCE family protein n=1 Tax=Actinomadura xylanilytica TaxID=887459 RepID=UPI00255ACAD6|nr:MlaD family protein [Actinomadura xylanilytica]MDL4776311.1 MlaD family protein [Actinomadura xylanilytica]